MKENIKKRLILKELGQQNVVQGKEKPDQAPKNKNKSARKPSMQADKVFEFQNTLLEKDP